MRLCNDKEAISLSIVIPVYNTAKWLRECLDSILSQDAFDIEVICVDDGSTDESPEILREYADKDSRIKIITQKNQGQSAARNNGMDAAKSEYIWFFDSDDTINPKSLADVFQAIIHNNKPQMICFPAIHSFCDSDYNGIRSKKDKQKKPIWTLESIHTGPEALQVLFKEKRYWLWVCMHIIRKDFLTENGLRFLEDLKRHEDVEFMIRVYRDAVSVLCIPQIVANHRVREGSSIDLVENSILVQDVRYKITYILYLYRIYAESEILQEKTTEYLKWLMIRIARCQKYYYRLIKEDPKAKTVPLFTEDKNKEELFDLLIRYPVETGKSLLELDEANKKLASGKYCLYTFFSILKNRIHYMLWRK